MKKLLIYFFLLFVAASIQGYGQNISINESGAAPDNSAMLDVTASDKGVLIPRMTAAQRLAITNPANGLLVFQTDVPRGFFAYIAANTVWTRLTFDSTLNLERVLLGGNDAANNAILNVSRVGVGTSTPVSEVHVVRNQGASSNAGAFIDIQNSSGINRSLAGLRFKVNSMTNNQRYQAAILHRWVPTDIYQLNFAIRDNSTTTLVDTSDIKMTINHFGNVGIGTTRPSEMLNLSTDVGDANLLIEADTDNNDETDNPSIRLEQDGGIVNGALGLEGNAGDLFPNSLANGMYLGTFSNYPFQILTNSSSRMTVATSGNIGVGVETPVDRLEVFNAGNVRVRTRTTTNGFSGFVAENSLGEYFVGVQGAGEPYPGEFQIFQNSAPFGQRMVIDNTGNMGIGQSNPAARLHINSTNRMSQIIESSNTSGTWLALRNSSVGGQYHQIISTGSTNGEGPGKMLFGYGNTAGTVNGVAMTIEDRRIGIGTSNPSNDLHIEQSDANLNSVGGMRYSYLGTFWRLFYSGIHFSFEDDGTRVAYVEGTTGNYVQPSDINLKANIKPINSVLNKVKLLRPVSYNYNNFGNKAIETTGFIAQEVNEIFPSLVKHGENGEVGLAYSEFSVLAIKAIQEQQEIIDQLVKQMKELEEEINLLKSEK